MRRQGRHIHNQQQPAGEGFTCKPPEQVEGLLVVRGHSSPAADGAGGGIMPLSRAVLPAKVDEAQVQIVPLVLSQQHLQVCLGLLDCLAFCEAPPQRQAVDVGVHRKGWCAAGPPELSGCLSLLCHTIGRSRCSSFLSPLLRLEWQSDMMSLRQWTGQVLDKLPKRCISPGKQSHTALSLSPWLSTTTQQCIGAEAVGLRYTQCSCTPHWARANK